MYLPLDSILPGDYILSQPLPVPPQIRRGEFPITTKHALVGFGEGARRAGGVEQLE